MRHEPRPQTGAWHRKPQHNQPNLSRALVRHGTLSYADCFVKQVCFNSNISIQTITLLFGMIALLPTCARQLPAPPTKTKPWLQPADPFASGRWLWAHPAPVILNYHLQNTKLPLPLFADHGATFCEAVCHVVRG